MKSTTSLFAGLLVLTLAAGSGTSLSATLTRKEASPSDRQFREQTQLAEARKQVDTLATSIEDLTRLLAEAKASNDKARMKAALEAGLVHLAGMKTHADKCKRKMEGMKRHMGGKNLAPADTAQAPSPEENPHEGH